MPQLLVIEDGYNIHKILCGVFVVLNPLFLLIFEGLVFSGFLKMNFLPNETMRAGRSRRSIKYLSILKRSSLAREEGNPNTIRPSIPSYAPQNLYW